MNKEDMIHQKEDIMANKIIDKIEQNHNRFENQLDNSTLLARIDERTLNMANQIASIEDSLKTKYVDQEEFRPVKSIVFGGVKLVLVAVAGSLIYLVVKH